MLCLRAQSECVCEKEMGCVCAGETQLSVRSCRQKVAPLPHILFLQRLSRTQSAVLKISLPHTHTHLLILLSAAMSDHPRPIPQPKDEFNIHTDAENIFH